VAQKLPLILTFFPRGEKEFSVPGSVPHPTPLLDPRVREDDGFFRLRARARARKRERGLTPDLRSLIPSFRLSPADP
jgi:hypothetical protein